MATKAYWLDIGTPENYLRANLDALLGRYQTAAVPNPRNGMVLRSAGAHVSSLASVDTSCVGGGARIEERSLVMHSVLLPGVVVGAGARISASIVGQDARVLPGAVLSGATIADGQVVGFPE
jgi:ADP-glucose pyrophosphorylase